MIGCVAIDTGTCGSEDALKLQYLNNSDAQLKNTIGKLINLRKYSKMRCSKNKFYYS